MSPSTDAWKFEADGEQFAALCVDLTVYWKGSVFDRRNGVLDFYTEAMKQLGKNVRFYETESMKGAKPLKPDALEMLPSWLEPKAKRRDIYMMQMEGGRTANEPSCHAFIFKANSEKTKPGGLLRLVLPTSAIDDDPDAFLTLAQRLVKTLRFDSGHAGYALNWDPRGDYAGEANTAMLGIRNRYLGIDLPHLTATVIAVKNAEGPGLKSVNWLTLLGESLLAKAGGQKKLETTLKKQAELIAIGNGVIIRAGARPVLGDVNRKEDVSAYRAVGKALAPLRLTAHPEFLEDPQDPGGEPTREWLARFD